MSGEPLLQVVLLYFKGDMYEIFLLPYIFFCNPAGEQEFSNAMCVCVCVCYIIYLYRSLKMKIKTLLFVLLIHK